MTVGLSSFVLGSPVTASVLDAFPALAELGYGLVEVAYEPQAPVGAAQLRAAADAAGLDLAVAGNFTAARDVSADDEALRAAGLGYLVGCVDFAVAIGARVVAGPMYSAVGKTRLLPPDGRERQRRLAAEGIGRAADHAAQHGVRLAIEPLNRFETDLVNTTAQALALCDEVGRDNVGLSLDTFHMNVEESSLGGAIAAAGARLFSFQASENDRGTPGSGHVPWDEAFRALAAAGYCGPVIVEAFRVDDDPELASALSLWRPVVPSMERLMREAVAFIAPRWGV